MTTSSRNSLAALSVASTALILSFALGHSVIGAQSLSYTSGQNISPAYEGWENGEDGAKYFLFGYMNRNWVEEVDVPVGPDNGFNVGGADQGQPTHFLPRRNRFVFRVKVPATFTEKDELIWTLTTKGKTEKAYATLRPDYLVDDVVKASETGSLGAGTSSPETRANKAPKVVVEGEKTRTVKAGQPLTLVAVITDDGIPKSRTAAIGAALLARALAPPQGRGAPANSAAASGAPASGAAPSGAAAGTPGTPATPPAQDPAVAAALAARRNPGLNPPVRITVGKSVGLHFSWYVFRGSGAVTFDPVQIKVWEDTRAGANSPWAPSWTPPRMPADGRMTVQATFAEPGSYWLRGSADDGALLTGSDVMVTVTP